MRTTIAIACVILGGCGSAQEQGGSAIDAGSSDTGAGDGAASDAARDAPSGPSDAGFDAAIPPGWRAIAFTNQCADTIWVGALGNPVTPSRSCAGDADCADATLRCNPASHLCTYAAPNGGGWSVDPAKTVTVALPPAWAGRFWPRTGCKTFNGNGVPACDTGDCGGHLGCPVGVGGTPPATLAELTLVPHDASGPDFYDVSNVDGANVPLMIAPSAGTFDPAPPAGADATYWCTSPGCRTSCGPVVPCAWTLASGCPTELRVTAGGQYVGCRSAHQACAVDPTSAPLKCAENDDLYACSPNGPNAVTGSCYAAGATPSCCGCPSWAPSGACVSHDPAWESPSLPEKYANVFKTACPSAYAFPFDDPTSTFTCKGTSATNVGYAITFCP